jgi:hypothetical protein
MNQLEQKPEPQRHYSIENYRATAPQRVWVEPTPVEPTPLEIRQRHDAVMVRLHKEARRWRRIYEGVLVVYGCIGTAMILRETCKAWLRQHFPGADDVIPFASLGAQLTGLCTIYFRGQVAKEMASSADKRDIGAFIEGWQINRPVTQGALVRLLPTIRASDCGLLQMQHRSILRRLVASRIPYRSRVPLIVAILKAYEQVGDVDDIPVVERLAAGGGYGKYKQVRQAAEDCLPALRIVAPQHREQVTLLRASDSNEANTANLVRPAEATAEVDSNEMLRASIMEAVQP